LTVAGATRLFMLSLLHNSCLDPLGLGPAINAGSSDNSRYEDVRALVSQTLFMLQRSFIPP